jgi:hypothetical protein
MILPEAKICPFCRHDILQMQPTAPFEGHKPGTALAGRIADEMAERKK